MVIILKLCVTTSCLDQNRTRNLPYKGGNTRAAMYPDHERISLDINSRTGRSLFVTVHPWGFPTDTLVSCLAPEELGVVSEAMDTHMTSEGNEDCIKQLNPDRSPGADRQINRLYWRVAPFERLSQKR